MIFLFFLEVDEMVAQCLLTGKGRLRFACRDRDLLVESSIGKRKGGMENVLASP